MLVAKTCGVDQPPPPPAWYWPTSWPYESRVTSTISPARLVEVDCTAERVHNTSPGLAGEPVRLPTSEAGELDDQT